MVKGKYKKEPCKSKGLEIQVHEWKGRMIEAGSSCACAEEAEEPITTGTARSESWNLKGDSYFPSVPIFWQIGSEHSS